MKFFLIAVGMFLSVFISSCNSEEDESGNLLKKMKFVGSSWTDDLENHEFIFEYSDNNKLIRYSDGNGAKAEFTYTNDLITQVDFYSYVNQEPFNHLWKINYFYDSQNRLIKYEKDELSDLLPVNEKAEYTYVDFEHVNYNIQRHIGSIYAFSDISGVMTLDGNNVIQILEYESNVSMIPINEYNLFYDNKKNPFSNIIGYKALGLGVLFSGSIWNLEGFVINGGIINNSTSMQLKTYNGQTVISDNTYPGFNYQYGNNDFPNEISSGNRKILLEY